jgi:hypothetical protein
LISARHRHTRLLRNTDSRGQQINLTTLCCLLYTIIHIPINMVNARPRASSASYLQSLPFLLGPIFDQVQNTVANHRKNLVSLRNIQEQCSGITAVGPRGLRAIGEKAFNALFIDMVNRILPIKKGVAVADRAVKFVASYVAYTTEQGQCPLESSERMLIGRSGL